MITDESGLEEALLGQIGKAERKYGTLMGLQMKTAKILRELKLKEFRR